MSRPLLALYTASGLSLGGNALGAVLVPLYVLETTGSPLAAGAAGACAAVPVVAGGALGGVLVDRVGFRRAAIVADLLSGLTVLAIPLLALTVGLPLWALLILVFLGGVFDTPGSTAKMAMAPDLAAGAGIAVSRPATTMSVISRLATLIGASAAALLVVLVGPLAAFVVDGVAFLVGVVILLLFVPRVVVTGPVEPVTGYWRELADGFRFIAREPVIRMIIGVVLVTNLVDAAGLAVLRPSYARTVDETGAVLGVMVAVGAGGAIVGGALFHLLDRRVPRGILFSVCFVLAGPGTFAVMALDAPLPVLLAVFGLAGVAAGPINPLLSTVLYERVPRALRARVLGAVSTGVNLGTPVGALVAGLAVDAFGLQAVLVGAAVVYLLVTLSTFLGKADMRAPHS